MDKAALKCSNCTVLQKPEYSGCIKWPYQAGVYFRELFPSVPENRAFLPIRPTTVDAVTADKLIPTPE